MILVTCLLDVVDDRGPHLALRWIVGRAGLALDAEDSFDSIVHFRVIAADKDHSRRAVAGDVCAGGIRDEAEVFTGEEVALSVAGVEGLVVDGDVLARPQ